MDASPAALPHLSALHHRGANSLGLCALPQGALKRSRSRGRRGDGVAEATQAFDHPVLPSLGLVLLPMGLAQVRVALLASQEVIGTDEDTLANRHCRSLATMLGRQPSVAR